MPGHLRQQSIITILLNKAHLGCSSGSWSCLDTWQSITTILENKAPPGCSPGSWWSLDARDNRQCSTTDRVSSLSYWTKHTWVVLQVADNAWTPATRKHLSTLYSFTEQSTPGLSCTGNQSNMHTGDERINTYSNTKRYSWPDDWIFCSLFDVPVNTKHWLDTDFQQWYCTVNMTYNKIKIVCNEKH